MASVVVEVEAGVDTGEGRAGMMAIVAGGASLVPAVAVVRVLALVGEHGQHGQHGRTAMAAAAPLGGRLTICVALRMLCQATVVVRVQREAAEALNCPRWHDQVVVLLLAPPLLAVVYAIKSLDSNSLQSFDHPLISDRPATQKSCFQFFTAQLNT